MDAQIEIKDVELIERTNRNNKIYFKQPAWLHTDKQPYPVSVLLYVKDRSMAYQTGFYELTIEPYVDKFKGLSFHHKLMPVK